MQSNKTFCIKPWTQACVRTNGDITLCCRSTDIHNYNLKTVSIDEWWSSEYLATIRHQLLNNIKPAPCAICFAQEQQGAVSLRQKTNQEYKIIEQYAEKMLAHYGYPTPAPIEIELQLTNLCNLKCLMCNEDESSTLFAENKILKISKIDPEQYTITESEIVSIRNWLLTKPKVVNIRGGEPMIVPELKELMLWAIEQGLLDDTKVCISTNLTKLDSDWEKIIRSCAQLRLMVSLDAVGDLYEYIRYGAKWATIEENISKLADIKDSIVVHATVQNLNILHIDKLIKWCETNSLSFDFEPLHGPIAFTLESLPTELLEQAKLQLTDHSLLPILDAVKFNSDRWTQFQKEINLRDTIRKTSILDVLPEFKGYWNAKKA